jgi:phosphatidylserine/phosphatidylglycerophosphate/cardiolipin synthase-like enzyme
MPHRAVIVLPDDTRKPIMNAIESAKRSLRIKMFLFNDTGLVNAVIDAQNRGVNIRIILNSARRDGEEENEGTRKILGNAGVEVRDGNPLFVLTHEKSMVVDDKTAFVQSLNWHEKNFVETRDYAIITTKDHEVDEIINCFEADWYRQNFDSGDNAHLIWCPGNGRSRIARFIDETEHTLFVQNERFQDMIIIERLVRAMRRGVKVHLMARPPHSLKKDKLIEGVSGLRLMDDVGIKIHKLKHHKLHGKMFLADGSRAIIGSINLTQGSFDDRRELAIEVNDDDIIERLEEISHQDWKNSHPLDLSDEGLFNDLEYHGEGGAEKLALDIDEEKIKKNHEHDHNPDHKKK